MTDIPSKAPRGRSFRRSVSGTRRGHMVSKGYISAWANERNVIDVLDVQDRRGYPSSIENASVVSYVYDPAVLTHDLEGQFGDIEDAGTSAFTKLRAGDELTPSDTAAVVEFLDMHLHRGRYADRAGDTQPAVLMMKDGSVQDAELNYGDLLSLAHDHPDTLRLTTLGLEQRVWKLYPMEGLYTGDGAVLLWGHGPNADPTTITFPLSPTQLLVIGDDLADDININRFIVHNCRRWIVGQRGTLPIEAMKKLSSRRTVDRN